MIRAAQPSIPLVQFLRWWLDELRGCVPAGLWGAISRRPQTLTVIMSAERATFELRKAGKCREIGCVDINLGNAPMVRAELSKIRRRINLHRVDIVLCFTREQVLRREVNLPLAALENLREVLTFEMDRHTPFRASDVYFGQRLVGTDDAEKRISVDLVVVARAIADQAVGILRRWDLPPDRVSAVGSGLPNEEPLDLLVPDADPRQGRIGRRLAMGLALVAGGLAVAAAYLEIHQQQQLLAVYEAGLEESRASGVEANALRKQVADLLERSRYVVQQKQMRPSLVALLEEVTRLLPDNTWVSQFRLQGDQLALSGYSPAASRLIGLLEESLMLTEVRFVSPVTLDPKLGVERFNLSASVVDPGSGQ